MSDEKRGERLTHVKAEFQRLLEFHAQSFVEIDGKAKYWLTLTLPAFVALMGYLIKAGDDTPIEFLVPSSALLGCLFISTFFFSSVLASRRVESGILVPASRKIDDVNWYLENEEQWEELSTDQAAEMLRSIANNEAQNSHKSARLRLGEISLLRGTPTSICLAAVAAFLYTATCPSGLPASTSGICTGGATSWTAVGAGVVISALTTAALVVVHHVFTKS